MTQGAYSVHKEIRQELENYIKTQYFGKTPLLFNALKKELSQEGVLYREPYIESSPAYKQVKNGIGTADIEDWLKVFFKTLITDKLGVYETPYDHQIRALEASMKGEDIFVSTGTGSGKTECFMWPLTAKLVKEARESTSWNQRGIRVMVMYPMNALVSDQLSRLRNLIGDSEEKFARDFRACAGAEVRRPQFGMYTGRTPYPGPNPKREKDQRLATTYSRMLKPQGNDPQKEEYYNALLKDGRIPAKADLDIFIDGLLKGEHRPDPEDAELLTRFEMQEYCPDIMITNYSMLEYMLFRTRESKIWEDTKKWLDIDPNNRLMFIIDEAHMYRGSSGGEVALLIRRLFHKLGIAEDRVQFILTTASMPDSDPEDKKAVQKFAYDLTGKENFCYLTGVKEELNSAGNKELHFVEPTAYRIEGLEDEEVKLDYINEYWKEATDGEIQHFEQLDDASSWMYDHLVEYRTFKQLIQECRGKAASLSHLAETIFPDKNPEMGQMAVSMLISIAQLAKSDHGDYLFPAKMHLLFRGLKGVYACSNSNCSKSHSNNGVELGDILILDSDYICPECGSSVYELYQDRRCGALFYKGYIAEGEFEKRKGYLWHYPGQVLDKKMFELHLFIPSDDFVPPRTKSKNAIKPCYLNIKNGFIDFKDDTHKGDPCYRKLYYCDYTPKDAPDMKTFTVCPHCNRNLSRMRLSGFATKGNQSFNNLIKAQFNSQDPVSNRANDPKKYPNAGRKVLMFSDSRQRAATLARDMSKESDTAAARQLFMCAVNNMKEYPDASLDDIYGYFLKSALDRNVHIFDSKFNEDCGSVEKDIGRNNKKRPERRKPLNFFLSKYTISKNSHPDMQEQFLRLFCDNYNTLIENALCWVEPTDVTMENIIDDISGEFDIDLDVEGEYEKIEKKTLEIFNAWFINICDANQAIGPTIPNYVRDCVRRNYKEGFGLKSDWTFSKEIKSALNWDDCEEMRAYKYIFDDVLLEQSQKNKDVYFVKLDAVKLLYGPEHKWYRCNKCSEITPYKINGKCPCCGSEDIVTMGKNDMEALAFWRKPALDAINGGDIRTIDTEEHTAQLSHKDQQDDMWSKTEEYELRFQDLIKDDETPVDILSSTTTMEVGIDIGSLVAIGLRNIPPMRENYQQRAGRAGRRGAALSTIVTFCENGPYDTMYFNNPVPMFQGDPRRPWIDNSSSKLLQRHLNMIVLQDYLMLRFNLGMDEIATIDFVEESNIGEFSAYLINYKLNDGYMLAGKKNIEVLNSFKPALTKTLQILQKKCYKHPELYMDADGGHKKSLLDALYEEGMIPTYYFPKDVVSLYVNDNSKNRTRIKYQVDRGLDVAIGEYAPGRSVVIDKDTYQIGGLYYPGTELREPKSPAISFINDPNYKKNVISCKECGWFGVDDHSIKKCPFCGNTELEKEIPMVKPWGFAPKNGRAYSNSQIDEEYSRVQPPLYSTLPKATEMQHIKEYKKIRKASRIDQSIIIINRGPAGAGFTVCPDCGAIMPSEKKDALKNVSRPYKSNNPCSHPNADNINLGYEFKTDMLVLEFELDRKVIDTRMKDNLWITRAATSLSEGLRLIAGKKLDIEFTELVTGYRIRNNDKGAFVDIYIYDSLSSGAGYSEKIGEIIEELLKETKDMLSDCDCDTACYKCLKHYRNQYVHMFLDRRAAIDLLAWGKDSALPNDKSIDEQWSIVESISQIIKEDGIDTAKVENKILLTKDSLSTEITIYPAMKKKPRNEKGHIYVSDYMMKYAKPTAVENILAEFGLFAN